MYILEFKRYVAHYLLKTHSVGQTTNDMSAAQILLGGQFLQAWDCGCNNLRYVAVLDNGTGKIHQNTVKHTSNKAKFSKDFKSREIVFRCQCLDLNRLHLIVSEIWCIESMTSMSSELIRSYAIVTKSYDFLHQQTEFLFKSYWTFAFKF